MLQEAELEAGPELDALIVQRIFGWKLYHDPVLGAMYEHPAGYIINPFHIMPYSTEDRAALQLLDRVDRYTLRFVRSAGEALPDIHHCYLVRYTGDGGIAEEAEATAETRALAICRARARAILQVQPIVA